MHKFEGDEYERRMRVYSVLISELPAEEQGPFRKHFMEGSHQMPMPMPGDHPDDMRVWRTDYKMWKAKIFGLP